MCLLAVLGSQGIMVKCTAAIFFRTVDSENYWIDQAKVAGIKLKKKRSFQELCDFTPHGIIVCLKKFFYQWRGNYRISSNKRLG